MVPLIADFSLVHDLIRIFFLHPHIEVNPFQNGIILKKRVKIRCAMSKNMWSYIPTALKCYTLRGYLGPLKTNFEDLKSKNGHSLMYPST